MGNNLSESRVWTETLQPKLPRDYDVNRREGLVDLEALDRPNVPVGVLERLTILLVTVRPT